MKEYNKRKALDLLVSQLKIERSSFDSHWKDIADLVFPRRQRFQVTDANKGERKNQKIIDSTATLAARSMRAGMFSGITSPARRWFRLTTPDPDMAEVSDVKKWLYTVETNMNSIFLKSNLYNALPVAYGDLGCFGTHALWMEEDFEEVVRFYPLPIGSYYLGNSSRGKVEVFVREFRMTVRQLIEKFGYEQGSEDIDWSKFSSRVKSYWDQDQLETWIDVTHVVQPNSDWNPNKIHSKYKRFESCYYETGSDSIDTDADNRYLKESGFDFFPVLAPRWELVGEDVYGTECPGMQALGDIKQLQSQEKRIAQAMEKMVNPPLVGPSSLSTQKVSVIPGDTTYVDIREGQQGLRPIYEVNFRIAEAEEKQQQIRQRISRAFYEDLFLMLANSDRREITAREIDERHEEKLLALGPVLEQLNQDLLDPLIDNTFAIMLRRGLIPEAPEQLQGSDLKVEYISIMSQAQKLVSLGGIERFTGFVGQLAQATGRADVLDKVNVDQIVDVYGDITSVPPSIIRSDDEVAVIKEQRAKAAQAQQQSEMIAQGAMAAKNLSQASLEGDSALTKLVGG